MKVELSALRLADPQKSLGKSLGLGDIVTIKK